MDKCRLVHCSRNQDCLKKKQPQPMEMAAAVCIIVGYG